MTHSKILPSGSEITEPESKTQASFVFFRKSFAGILRNFCGRVLLILMGLPTFFLIVEIIQGKINTEKQYFLMHNTSIYASIKLLFCKAANIIGEIQKVGNPERP